MRRDMSTWAVLDLVAVFVFVAIGRSVHGHAFSVAGLASTLWPFAVGLAAGWGMVAARRVRILSIAAGVAVCVATVAIGMLLRVVSGQGTAPAFVGVALGFLGLAMTSWRVARYLFGLRLERRHADQDLPIA